MEQIRIEASANLAQAARAFMGSVNQWMDACLAAYADAPASDCHDQATYTISWAPLLQRFPRPAVQAFLCQTRDRICQHFTDTEQWHHGYWRRHEIHHGTEHFEWFLGTLAGLYPADAATTRQLLDAAEHLGNWVEGVPAWYDWDQHLFRSMWLGTESIGDPESGDAHLNTPDHFRAIRIALLAWVASDEPRYLDLALDAVQPWIHAILNSGELPAAIDEHGPIYTLADNLAYSRFVGQAALDGTQLARAENLLASAVPDTLLTVWQITGDDHFRCALERILDVLAAQLIDPDAGAAADSIRRYRRLTGDHRYDDRIKAAMTGAQPMGFDHIGIELPDKKPGKGRPPGIGKRADKPTWFEDEQPRRHSPMLLALVAECSGDDVLAARSLDIGRAYLELARRVFPNGREHGCSARSVSAVARGHGRENNAGMITAVLEPILSHFEPELL